MTPKQQRFVEEYLIDLNATQAAIRAGYSEKTAAEAGYENLRKPQIAAAVAKALDERAQEAGVDALWVLREAQDVYRAARDQDRLSEALKALDLVGKHIDVQAFKERIEHQHNLSSMTDAELDAAIARHLSAAR